LTTALLEKDAFINNILQQNEEISKQLFAIKCELIEKERKISDAELMLQTCNKEIACANDRNSVLQKNLEETTAALTDSLNKEKESNERRIASQAEELKSFIDQSSRLTLEIEKLETALNQKAKELEEQEYNTRLTITQLTDYQSGYKKLQQELETTKASLDFVSAEKNNLIAELDNTYRHLELFKQENEEIKNKLTDSTAQNNALLKEITVQQNKNKSLQLAFQEMVQSRSWRFTKPLRLFYSLFK
jgi:chromosome segregation ATPase